jgi:hypothetical protein
MPRDRQRVNLKDGLKLDLNSLARRETGPVSIHWWNNYWDELTARGEITANMSGTYEGWFRINMAGGIDQWIILEPRPRPYGGFQCPTSNHTCSISGTCGSSVAPIRFREAKLLFSALPATPDAIEPFAWLFGPCPRVLPDMAHRA